MPKPLKPNFVLDVEMSELFIQAGLQDRVIQVRREGESEQGGKGEKEGGREGGRGGVGGGQEGGIDGGREEGREEGVALVPRPPLQLSSLAVRIMPILQATIATVKDWERG